MADPSEKTGLRFRVFVQFALIAVAVPVLLGGGLWLASNRLGAGSAPPLILFGGAAGFALIGVAVWVWMRFDTGMVAAIQGLARDLQTLTHSNPEHEIQADPARSMSAFSSNRPISIPPAAPRRRSTKSSTPTYSKGSRVLPRTEPSRQRSPSPGPYRPTA